MGIAAPFDGTDWSAMFWGMDMGSLVDFPEQEN